MPSSRKCQQFTTSRKKVYCNSRDFKVPVLIFEFVIENGIIIYLYGVLIIVGNVIGCCLATRYLHLYSR